MYITIMCSIIYSYLRDIIISPSTALSNKRTVVLSITQSTWYIIWMVVLTGFIAYLFIFDKSTPSKAVVSIKGIGAAGIGILLGMNYLNYKEVEFKQDLKAALGAESEHPLPRLQGQSTRKGSGIRLRYRQQ